MRTVLSAMAAAAITLLLLLNCVPMSMAADARGEERDSGTQAQRAVECPDHDGPWNITGFRYEQFRGSTKSYDINIKIFYPAMTAADNATANTTGGPFMTLIMLPPFGGPEETYNFNNPRIVSWGFVCVVIGLNWNDFPNSANITDMEEILDQLESDNSTPANPLYGMIDKECFAIFGYSSGGGLSILDATFVSRLKAISAFAPAIGDSTLVALAPYFTKPVQVQAGANDSTYRPHTETAYRVFSPPKFKMITRDGSHGGPFFWEPVISFYQRYVRNITGYDYFLNDWGAMDDVANLNYSLSFTLPDGTFFPGNLSYQGGPTSLNESQSASFTGAYTGYLPIGHPRAAFSWDFDNNGAVDAQDPINMSASHVYNRSGIFKTGFWFAIGEYRLLVNSSIYVSVANLAPSIKLPANYTAVEDEELIFKASGSDSPNDNETLQYSWSFGDGTSQAFGDVDAASHTYTKAGNFVLTATVKDNDGAAASATSSVKISNLPPTATVGNGTTVLKDDEVGFTGFGNDTPTDLSSLMYRWDFGDGSMSEWSPGADALHVYSRSGNFTANMTVKDDDGATASASLTVTVSNTEPYARIRLPALNFTAGKDFAVEFDGSGSDSPSDNSTLQYRWEFGDGNSTNWTDNARAEHIYAKGGRYTVTLIVRDCDGAEGRASQVLVVMNQKPKALVVQPVATEAEEDEPVYFTATGDDSESDRANLNFTWVIDGRTFYGSVLTTTFKTSGLKNFTLSVIDPEGASDTVNGSITIRNAAPWVSGTVTPDKIYVNDSVNFTAAAGDTASDIPSLALLWDLGDNTTGAAPNGTHNYTRPGTYVLRLSVTDNDGLKAERTYTVIVLERPAPPKPPVVTPPETNKVNWMFPALAATGAMLLLVALVIGLKMRQRPPEPRYVPRSMRASKTVPEKAVTSKAADSEEESAPEDAKAGEKEPASGRT
jgi:hypothetical protein